MTQRLDSLVAAARELLSLDEATLSRAVLEACVLQAPGHLQAWVELANVQWILGAKSESLEASLHAAALAPHELLIQSNIAQQLGSLGLEAPIPTRLAMDDAGHADYRFCLAEALDRQAQFEVALLSYRKAVALQPDNPRFHIHLGYALLRLGHWREGWREMTWYWNAQGFHAFSPWALAAPRPVLRRGDAIQGKSILVTGWGGVGDLVMFTQLAQHLTRRGAAKVSLHISADVAFFSGNRWAYPIVSDATVDGLFKRLARYDAWVPNASLVDVLELNASDIGPAGPYFSVDAARTATWRGCLATPAVRKKIGLAWSGNPDNLYEKNRSIATQHLLALLKGTPQVDWFVVQKNPRNAELKALALPHVFDHSEAFANLQDTAALMAQLDLVVSVDSLPAHLSASLGVPTWLLLSAAADWRWGIEGDASPWYGGMRLYRQKTLGDWAELLERVGADIQRLLPPR